jgi:competence protein ComEC
MLLISLCCAWALGIWLGSKFNVPFTAAFAVLVPLFLALFFKRYQKPLLIMLVSLISFFGAVFYVPTTHPEANTLAAFTGQTVELKGIISTPPDIRDNITHLQLSVQTVNRQPVQGTVLLFVSHYPEYRYGDVLLINGKLENPPQVDGFDYQAYLARAGIYTTMLNPGIQVLQHDAASKPLQWIYSVRERLSRSISQSLPEPQASLTRGIVLGISSSIPADLKNDLSITGTAHLLAISGINLTIIAGILVSLGLWIFGRRHYIYVWLALFVIWFYSLLTGLQAPVVRGAIMASVFLCAELLGRQKNAFAALALSAAIMAGIDPQLLFSVSFQLTFLAMIGLIFVAPPLQALARRAVHAIISEENSWTRILTFLTDSLAVSLSAVILVWPVIAYNFGLVSFVGPLSTLLIAPALTPIILTGAVTSVVGIISPPVAHVIGWSAWLFVSYFIWLVQAFAALPSASIHTGPLNSGIVWAYYCVLALAVSIRSNFKKLTGLFPVCIAGMRSAATRSWAGFEAVPKKFVIIPLLVLAFLTSFAAVTLPDNNLHVSFLDVGEGDAILVQSGNQNVLIDGGPSPQAINLGLSSRLPFWDRNLDMVILTHPHLDHLSGLVEVLQRYKVQKVFAPNLVSDSPAFQEWIDLIKAKGIPSITAQAGQRIRLNDGAELDIINPTSVSLDSTADLENNGLVAKLTLNNISFLFTADIGSGAEAALISRRADINCAVLKVAHHGSSTSTSADFLRVARPQIAVIPTGSDNTFGHPDQDVLERLNNTVLYRTDLAGTIEFTTDGERLWVRTDR